MAFFLLVRGIPVYLIRVKPAQIWWSSIAEISPSYLASQTTAIYEDLEVSDFSRIEYRIRGLKGGLISSSASEVIPVSTFTNEDIQQHRVVFYHDGKSFSAGFKFSLIYGNYESAAHDFNIEVKAVTNLSLKLNPIVGQIDFFRDVSMTNINSLLILADKQSYDLTRACKTGGLQVEFKVMDAQPHCFFVAKRATNIYTSTLQTSTFTQCDIYSGHVLISCPKSTQIKTSLSLKAQVIDSISSNHQRIIYVSEIRKIEVVILEKYAETSRRIAIAKSDGSTSLRLDDIRMYGIGYTVYQPTRSCAYVLKSLPHYGDLLCDDRVVKVGDTVCKSLVYKYIGGSGMLDKFSLEVFPNSKEGTQSATVNVPVIIHRGDTLNMSKLGTKKPIRVTMNDTFVPLNADLIGHINGAIYVITKFPVYGDIYFNESKITSFSSQLLNRGEIYYLRNENYLSDFTSDIICIAICDDWPECQINDMIIEIQIAAFPVETKIIYQNIYYNSQNRSIPVRIEQRPPGKEAFIITLKPNIGQLLHDNFEVVEISSLEISNNGLSYYRPKWNTSNDEFVLKQMRPPVTMIFRVTD
ncbi:unnamed protein product [Rodentolepis nana]|uniref:A2M_N_2 domain-containing protein n=1 Tax=Rodentolepis nana TaxID=102285 RepID=A0A0R3TQ65_RODNA|nr:unnamed protein product [Rodentolepis nana]